MWFVALSPTAWSAPTVVERPQSGLQTTDVTISDFGRMAFEVTSEEGASLQLVDRMAGPGSPSGSVGGTDGRIDAFVDVGEVRVLTRGPNGAEGTLRVTATPFERLGGSPQLIAERPIPTTLTDKTERAWWIDHTNEAKVLHIEAIGRHVDDLRLWRDGSWLVDTRPSCTVLEPVVGQPITQCVLSVTTEPGLYQVVAYGGAGRPWANDAVDTTMQVQWDLPKRDSTGRFSGRLGPTGRLALQLDSKADVAHLELDEHAPTALHFGALGSSPFLLGSPEDAITDTSRLPVATAQSGGSRPKVIGIEGAPGQRFTLTWFDKGTRMDVPYGDQFITSLSTGRWQDHLPPTLVVSRRRDDRDHHVHEVAVRVQSGQVFRKRFNLLSGTRFLLRVDETSNHRVALVEGEGSVRVQPFFTTTPKNYKAPATRSGTWEESLTAGLYVVELLPKGPGVVTLEVTRNDWSDVAQQAVTALEEVHLPPELRTALSVNSDPHWAQVFTQGGIQTGLRFRPEPLALHLSHALPLAAGESWTAKVSTSKPITVRATRPNGEPIDLELLGNRGPQQTLQPGSWPLTLHNDGDPVVVTLAPQVSPPAPIALPDGRLTELPVFPFLSRGAPHFMDLGKNESRTLKLDVPRDGLYHLQSSGLLATSGSLRSRVTFGLGNGNANGIGRNFRIARYLRSGAYQVTVATRGSSAGHLGVELADVPMTEGGTLLFNEEARATVPPETGIVYRFEVDQRRRVQVWSGSPQGAFPCRIEDEDGWPMVRPTERCDLSVTLDPGTYVVRSLPSPVLSKRTTRIRTEAVAPERTGHGPFALTLGRTAEKTWVEPVGDGQRPHDTWTMDLPASATVTLRLAAEMTGELHQGGKVVARLVPGRDWSGSLEKGAYEVVVQAARRGTGIPYTLRATTDTLTVGQSRRFDSPAKVAFRVGEAGLITLRSDGMADVRARLLNAEGELVTANDDRPDGWDFQIATWLEAGDYTLVVNHVGANRRTTVHAEAPTERAGPAIALNGKPVQLAVSAIPTVHPIELGNNRKLLAIHATSDQNLGLAVQMKLDDGWVSLGNDAGRALDLVARRAPKTPVRLRIWSVDGRSGVATVNVDVPPSKAPGESALQSGVDLPRPGVAWTRNLDPGLFRVLGDRSGLQVCPAVGAPCQPAATIVALDDDSLLVGSRFQLQRADLTESVPVELTAQPTALGTGLTGLVAVSARTGTTLPGLRLAGDHASAAGRGASIAVGTGEASVWGTGGARMRAVALETVKQDWTAESDQRIEIPARTAVRIPLDKLPRAYPLALQRGLFARIGGAAVWADEDSRQAVITGSTSMLVANPTDDVAFATLSPPIDVPEPLTPDGALEWFAVQSGSNVYPVEPGAGQLEAHNATLVFRQADGTLLEGTSVDAEPGGWVEVRHGRGWTAVWSEASHPGPFRTATRKVQLSEPGIHRLTADGPFAAQISTRTRRDVVLRPEGGTVDVLVSNTTDVGIRPLGDQPDVRLDRRMVPVQRLSEGLGPDVLLEGGRDAWFVFDLTEDTTVGIGVKAEADRVDARLVSASGEEVARGVVAMADLPAGTWYLVLSQSPDAAPVRARPALAGLDRPDTGPPDAVVRTYLERAGFTAGGAQ